MYVESSAPQILYPPPSLLAISPPPPLYTPPNPTTLLALLKDLIAFFWHVLLRPFSARLIPCHPSHPYGISIQPEQQTQSTAVIPVRKDRRSRSKSPSSSPTTSMTLTEGTIDGPRTRQTAVERSGFDVKRIRIRSGKRRDAVVSKQESWAKQAFGY